MIQIDRSGRQVYIKFTDISYIWDILHKSNGTTAYKYAAGEISTFRLEITGIRTRRIRIANLPPAISGRTICAALSQYGKIQSIRDKTWSITYRYAVGNGIKIVMIILTKHIPSHVTIAGYRPIISYEGQPQTCYGCGDTNHMYHVCPKRRGPRTPPSTPTGHNWAHNCYRNPCIGQL
jgi:hypothetical protein